MPEPIIPEPMLPPPIATQPADIGEQTYAQRQLAAPVRAFELTLDTGYTQGFGDISRGTSLRRAADAGMSIDLGISHRISPSWAVGVSGGYQFYDEGDRVDDTARGATGQINAAYHFSPFMRLDPWLQAGVGYRYLHAGDANLHGLQLVNLDLGLDVRVHERFALTPLIGGGMNLFLWDGTDSISDPRLNTFVFAGLRARFDLGGTTRTPESAIASR